MTPTSEKAQKNSYLMLIFQNYGVGHVTNPMEEIYVLPHFELCFHIKKNEGSTYWHNVGRDIYCGNYLLEVITSMYPNLRWLLDSILAFLGVTNNFFPWWTVSSLWACWASIVLGYYREMCGCCQPEASPCVFTGSNICLALCSASIATTNFAGATYISSN